MSKPFDAVIFDLDGLLLDTESLALETGIEAMAGLGHTVSLAFMTTLIGTDGPTSHQLLCTHVGADIDPAVLNSDWNDRMSQRMTKGVPLRPQVHDILALLDAMALPRAVATNSRSEDAMWKLEKSGLLSRFGAVIGFDQVALGKPAPDVYLAAAQAIGTDPARCLAFEDSDTGVRAALAAGMTVVQIPDRQPSAEKRAHHMAESLMAGARLAGLH